MVTADRDGLRMTDDDLVSTTIVLLNAGHEATVHQIGNAVRLLLTPQAEGDGSGASTPPRARRPIDVQPSPLSSSARAERTLEECLRLAAPVHIFDRWVLEDLTLDAIPDPLRRGDRIGLILGAANVDPAKFTDPLRFDPARAEAPHLSFGAGIHFCIGAPLARLELQTALPILFERLPRLRLAAEPRVKDVYHFHGLERLDLVF